LVFDPLGRKLRSLRLARCPLLADIAFPPGQEQEMELGDNTSVDRLPPLALGHNAGNLRILDLAYCKITDNSIEGIIAHAPKIQTLYLTGCDQLTERALDHVCRLGDNLDVLGVGNISSITDAAIVRLARACPKLRGIDVGCK
jgi:F-box and leucine-rich repeat protein GRR1